MRTTFAAILLPLLVLNATFASGTGESISQWDTMDCWGWPNFGCTAWQWATLTVEECNDTTCRMTMNASIIGGANLIGTHDLDLVLVAGGGSSCVMEPLREAVDLGPCMRFCQRFAVVGFQAACGGSLTFNLTLPQDGNWTRIIVAGLYLYDQGFSQAHPSIDFWLRQLSDGTVEIDACGSNVGCSSPPEGAPPPRESPQSPWGPRF